jgi:PKD repeat protein
VTQDVDDDGLNELIYLRNDTLRCYDTLANAPTPSVRTDTPFYSERRTAAGEYIPPVDGSAGGNSAPVFSAVTPSNGASNIPIGTSSLSITIEDPDGDLFDWTIETSPDIGTSQANGASNGSKSCSISGLSYSTTYHWFVNATDGSGNWTNKSYWFATEQESNNPPNTPSKPTGPQYVGVDLIAEYITSATDPDGNHVYCWFDWGDNNVSGWIGPFESGGICTASHSWSKTGNYSIKVKARDIYDAESGWSPSITVTIVEIGPKADAGGPYVGFEGKSIQFSGLVIGGEEPYSWSWDFGDEIGTSTQQNPTYIYDSPGDYIVSLTVTDSNDDPDTDHAEVYVAPEGTLIVDSGGPYSGFSDETIEFTGSVVGGIPPYYWHWKFGDGDTSDEQNPLHVYVSNGNYTVTLTVTDNEGLTGNDTTIATISEEDITNPTVEIINPEDNFIYLLNSKLVPSFRTWIIGRITIDVEASDTESGIDYVEFYIDGKLKSTDITPPYSWEWSEITFFQHTIKVIAYDNVGNWESKELIIWKLF